MLIYLTPEEGGGSVVRDEDLPVAGGACLPGSRDRESVSFFPLALDPPPKGSHRHFVALSRDLGVDMTLPLRSMPGDVWPVGVVKTRGYG